MNGEAKDYFALFTALLIWFVPFLFSFFKITKKLWSNSKKTIGLRELRLHSFTLFGLRKSWSSPNERKALGTADDDLVYACRARIYRFRWAWGLLGFGMYLTILRMF